VGGGVKEPSRPLASEGGGLVRRGKVRGEKKKAFSAGRGRKTGRPSVNKKSRADGP